MGGDKKGIDYYTTPQKKCKRIKGLLPFYLWLRQWTFLDDTRHVLRNLVI